MKAEYQGTKYHGWTITDFSHGHEGIDYPLFAAAPPHLKRWTPAQRDRIAQIYGESRTEVKRKIRQHRARWGW